MKVLTKDLIGPALDWAVAVAEGKAPKSMWLWEVGCFVGHPPSRYSPSTNASHAFIIIIKNKIALIPDDGHRFSQWQAFCWRPSQHDLTFEDGQSYNMRGPTPLVAAMRCYVASTLGNEVNVPEELLS